MNDFDRDPISGLDLEKIYAVADNYSKSCGVVCRVINSMGETLHLSTVGNQSEVCDLAASILPGARNHGQTEKKSTFVPMHIYTVAIRPSVSVDSIFIFVCLDSLIGLRLRFAQTKLP
jgi:hypothetical protein